MFYIDYIQNKKILKSSLLAEFQENFDHLFTTKESFIKTKEENLLDTAKANRKLILGALNIDLHNLIEIKQTHSTNIYVELRGVKNPGFIDDTDGVILSNPGSATILNFADCTPIILYDFKNKILAGFHGGWRGTAGAISRLGVRAMVKNFNSKPEDIMAAIGPCIGLEDFETGLEVYEKLKTTVSKEDGLFKFKKDKPDKAFCDLAKINERQLIEEGVKKVDICSFKTYKEDKLLFSYRRENGTTNRISLVLKLKT